MSTTDGSTWRTTAAQLARAGTLAGAGVAGGGALAVGESGEAGKARGIRRGIRAPQLAAFLSHRVPVRAG